MQAIGIVLLLAFAQDRPGWLAGDGVLYSPCVPLAGLAKPVLSFTCSGVRRFTLAPIAPHPTAEQSLECDGPGSPHRHEIALDPSWDAIQVVFDMDAGRGAIDEFSVGESPPPIGWIALGAVGLVLLGYVTSNGTR